MSTVLATLACLAAVVWFIRYTDRLARTRHSSPL